MMKEKASRAFSISWKIAWAGLLISLPVTSFPFLSGLLGGAQVAPLALIPLAWLVLTWLPVALLRRGVSLPAESRPLFVFVLVAILTSLLAFFINTPPYKLHAIASNELDAFLTLGVGLCFFLVAIAFLQSSAINPAVNYISIGGMVLLAWSLAQGVVVWFLGNQYPAWMVTVHSWFATTGLGRLYPQMRVAGLAFEPSWLAHMLTMLYLPLWMSACWNRQSAFRFRLWKFILEDLLLVGGLSVLFMTFSRISLLTFMLALGWFILLAVHRITSKIKLRKGSSGKSAGRTIQAAISLLVLIVFVLGFMGLLFGLALRDARLVPLFQLGEQIASGELLREGLIPLAIRLNFAERAVYWELGWRVFARYPFLGVGLGNSGQFALVEMSHWGWEFTESRRLLFGETFLPNTKNLWTRLLSETGLVGFVFFITWLIVLWVSTRNLRESPVRLDRTIGLAGQLALVGMFVEGFSVDSFAMPYWWLMFGLLVAASFLNRLGGTHASGEKKE